MAKTPTRRAKPGPTRAAPRAGTPARKTAQPTHAPARKPAERKHKPVQPRPKFQWKPISPERKMDILGVVLALVGLITLLSLLSSRNSPLTGWLVNTLYTVAGWGAFVLPLALLALGLWLILRNVDRLPMLSVERLTGVVLLFLALLTLMHFLSGGGWEIAAAGSGGGYLGGAFERLFTGAFGVVGGYIVVAAWLLIAIILILDLSLPDLFRRLNQAAAQSRAAKPIETAPQTAAPPAQPGILSQLPSDFNPLPQRGAAGRGRSTGSAPASPVETTPAGTAAPSAASQVPSGANLPDLTAPQAQLDWTLPPVEAILDPALPEAVQTNVNQERARVIEETLAAFGAPGRVVEIHHGPTVTQFGLEPDLVDTRQGKMRVRVGKIVSLADDLALALASPRIRIQAPVPGRNYVGIEVPNSEVSRVALREVMESEAFTRKKSPLRFALGKDVAGKPAVIDLAALPHLLIAGTTGSGKSVCVNAILSCLLLNNTPADLRLLMVDTKRVELTGYNGIPHLLAPVVVEAEQVVNALQWIIREMDARYHRFAQLGIRNIQEYNLKQPQRLPYLVVVIDELADLMMQAPDETERSITRLAQLARATGIHLVIATQRPSVDVLTGLIKANLPARIAFAVASNVDSRVILDQPGAERLLGRGDMLFQSPDAPAPARLQGVYVSDPEIQRLVDTWRVLAAQITSGQPGGAVPVSPMAAGGPMVQPSLFTDGHGREEDPLLDDCIDLVRKEGRASVSMLQRRMRIGYTRAARLIDRMEEKGIIGPPQSSSQVREVLDSGGIAPPADDGA